MYFIDDLTVDESNILRRKVKTMEIRSDKLDELHNEVKHLRARSERFDEFLALTDELQKTIDEVNQLSCYLTPPCFSWRWISYSSCNL
jgi:chromosome segregation ATPase